jgi:hypothetical protein
MLNYWKLYVNIRRETNKAIVNFEILISMLVGRGKKNEVVIGKAIR